MMAVKLALILFAAIAVATYFVEGLQIGIQEAKSLDYYSSPSAEGIQGKILRQERLIIPHG